MDDLSGVIIYQWESEMSYEGNDREIFLGVIISLGGDVQVVNILSWHTCGGVLS